MKKNKNVAIVVAGGTGSRMGSNVPKQYLMIGEYPILYYSLDFLEKSFIDEIILVTRKEDIEYVQENFAKKYGFKKITKIVEGGETRAHSVYNGINSIEDCDFVYVHDGARPFINDAILMNAKNEVEKHEACVVGVKTKDTIKISDGDDFVISTPKRETLWQIQTPQVFSYELIKACYQKWENDNCPSVTDDASVIERYSDVKVKLVMGSYENIKITTSEDLVMANRLVENHTKKLNKS